MNGAAIREPTRDLRALADRGPVHFMGAGGAGMCALAEAVVRGGGRVTACDSAPGSAVRALERLGVRVLGGHDPGHAEGVAALVVSAAVPADHPEIGRAHELGIPVLKRAEALGSWVDRGTVVAAAGTHGKTTVTAMITSVLVEAGRDPTGFVGGEMAAWRSHLRAGRDDLFVVEADEYDRSFHHLRPDVTVVTNVEPDHLDVYGDFDGVREAFHRYLDGVREGGWVLACADDPGASGLLARVGARGRGYGLAAGSQLRAERVRVNGGGIGFRVREDGEDRGEIRLRVPGVHNVRNALGAAGAARALGVDWSPIRAALAEFAGVKRRFERLGAAADVEVVDDYAHHPTEVDAALAAARGAFPGLRLVAAFQPHLFTRTRDFHQELGRALAAADVVWVTDVYPAREAPIPGVDGRLVADAARAAGAAEVVHHPDVATLPAALAASLRPGDACITLGAGSIEKTGPALLAHLGAAGAATVGRSRDAADEGGGSDG